MRYAIALLVAASLPVVALGLPVAPQEGEGASNDRGALVTDRPDATESSETVGQGLFQLEGGYTFASFDEVDVHSVGEILLRIGLLHENVELRLGFNSLALQRGGESDATGFGNFGIGAKIRVMSGGGVGHAKPTVALLVGTSIPTGSDEIDSPNPWPEVRVAAAWDLTERLSFGTNLLWVSIKEDELDERHTAWGLTAALGYGLSDRWGAYFEYFGAYPTGERDSENYLNGGLTYLINNDLQLDGRFGYGLNGRDDDFFVGFGTAVRWGGK